MTPPMQETLDDAAREAGLELRFRDHGEAYERAKAVADHLGVDVRTYLLLCIKEGHALLKRRAGLDEAAVDAALDVPAILRRPAPADPRERAVWEQVRALFG
ncbi:hypothetical protein [Azospirillum soli]|uniref:hypothetical protein n=1 Tax=Azospirillum soli TaxID=1304799 RepID=UPI001AE20782|nr:hypothetical protein [Azospirillum soli]MBP2316813.1 hypothetical protein [Azospirillum soli]